MANEVGYIVDEKSIKEIKPSKEAKCLCPNCDWRVSVVAIFVGEAEKQEFCPHCGAVCNKEMVAYECYALRCGHSIENYGDPQL